MSSSSELDKDTTQQILNSIGTVAEVTTQLSRGMTELNKLFQASLVHQKQTNENMAKLSMSVASLTGSVKELYLHQRNDAKRHETAIS